VNLASKHMNIILVLPRVSYRGGERIFYTLALGLTRLGHRVKIITASVDEKNAFPFDKKILLVSPPKLINMFLQSNVSLFLFSFPVLLVLLALSAKDTDIIDSESFFSLWASIIIGKLFGKKVVWTIFAFERKPLGGSLLNNLFAHTLRKIDRFFARQADGYACIAPRIARVVKRTYGIEGVRLTIPAIDLARFKKAKRGKFTKKFAGERGKLLLLPATLHPKKNQELAIYSLKRILKVFPGSKLILLGEGKDEGRLRRLSKSLGLNRNVVFAGVAKGGSMGEYYKISDVVLVTSKVENEGLSMTAFEALACWKMPIVSKGAGAAEIIEGKRIGLVANPTPADYSRMVIEYLGHPGKYKTILSRGNRFVRGELTLEKFARDTEELFFLI